MKNLTYFKEDGLRIVVSIGYGISFYEKADKQISNKYINSSSKQGVSWEHNNKQIIIADPTVSVIGYPTVNLDYVVVIYDGIMGEFKPPQNAVIYNLDGSIHKILEVSSFISYRLINRIKENGDSNPPTQLPHKELIPSFKGFGWEKDKIGNLFNYISVKYDRDYGEGRILNPDTGQLGELVDDWHEYH